jgi:hypothetical protein
MFEIPLMQLPPKSIFPTTHGLIAMPPKHVTMSHLMEEHSRQKVNEWMLLNVLYIQQYL